MNKSPSILICSLFALSAVAAERSSTAEEAEARAILDRAIAALKADKLKAIEAFNSGYGVGDFKTHTLYVYCANTEGRFTAHPKLAELNLKGANLKDAKDKNGKEIGKEMIAKAKEGTVGSFTYMYDRPGSDKPALKEALVTKVGDQLCGIAYFKPQP